LGFWVFFGWFGGIAPLTARAQGDSYELQVIRLSDPGEKVLFRAGTEPRKTFRIGYTHSWDKCPIIEVFRIQKDGTITQEEEMYGWFGAGLEFNPPGGFAEMKDGMIHIRNMKRNLDSIPIRVGWISGFRLEYEEEVIPLDSLGPPGTLVSIRVSRRPSP
jgi:hypothetical protein